MFYECRWIRRQLFEFCPEYLETDTTPVNKQSSFNKCAALRMLCHLFCIWQPLKVDKFVNFGESPFCVVIINFWLRNKTIVQPKISLTNAMESLYPSVSVVRGTSDTFWTPKWGYYTRDNLKFHDTVLTERWREEREIMEPQDISPG